MDGSHGHTNALVRQPGDFDPRALRRIRFRAGLTQGQLATECGVSRVRITQLENPNTPDAPSAPLFRALADALGVEPERLEVPAGGAPGAAKKTATTAA
jgi:transcriptional regulator with XRE-family HTH domain